MTTIQIRPLDRQTEWAYVLSTARRTVAMHYGGPYVDWRALCALVDPIASASVVEVAAYEGEPDQIIGWAAWSPAGALELLYLRKSFEEAPKAAVPVVEALLAHGVLPYELDPQDRWPPWADPRNFHRQVVMRRAPTRRMLEAIQAAGIRPRVVPGAV